MAIIPAIFQRYTDNILADAVITATASPQATYALATLAAINPAARVLFSTGTVTITFTIASARGDILCIPMHNFAAGAGILTLTNSAGLSVAITIPAYRVDGFPPTLVIDLTLLASAGTRTSTVWNLVITNSSDVQLGGAVMIYGTRRDMSGLAGRNASWQYTESETRNFIETPNEYMTPYIQDYGTLSRQVEISVVGSGSDITAIENWFRANYGGVRPSLLWLDPNVVDAYVGRWQKTKVTKSITGTKRGISIVFSEWPKGLVV